MAEVVAGAGGRTGRLGHAACAAYLAVFALLWAVHAGWLHSGRAVLALCLLPSLALAAILLDLADSAGELRDRVRLIRAGGAARLAGARVAGIVVGKALCWAAVPAILAVAMPPLWRDATGQTVEMPSLQVLRTGRDLYVEGEIGRGFARRLAEALDRNPGIRTVMLDSVGGLSAEGVAARGVIAGRRLDTYVDGECHSACVDVFLGGVRREAAPGARFGLHHPGIGIVQIGLDARSEIPEGFLAGLPGGFRDRALGTPYGGAWFPEPDELVAAGVVTRFDPGADRPLVPRRSWLEPAGAYAALVRPSLLGRLDAGQGEAVRAVIGFAARAARDARPRGAFLVRLRLMVSRLALARVAAAPDAAVAEAGRALLSAMDAAAAAAPALCARVGAGADLLAAHGIERSAAGGSPVEALLDAAVPSSPPATPGVVAAGDGAWDAAWDGPPGGARDGAGGDGCAAEAAFYRSALAEGAAGAARLRARFAAVVAAGPPGVDGPLGAPVR